MGTYGYGGQMISHYVVLFVFIDLCDFYIDLPPYRRRNVFNVCAQMQIKLFNKDSNAFFKQILYILSPPCAVRVMRAQANAEAGGK